MPLVFRKKNPSISDSLCSKDPLSRLQAAWPCRPFWHHLRWYLQRAQIRPAAWEDLRVALGSGDATQFPCESDGDFSYFPSVSQWNHVEDLWESRYLGESLTLICFTFFAPLKWEIWGIWGTCLSSGGDQRFGGSSKLLAAAGLHAALELQRWGDWPLGGDRHGDGIGNGYGSMGQNLTPGRPQNLDDFSLFASIF